MSELHYSIVIPVFQAENSIEKLDTELRNFFNGKYSFEIIYVDDYSQDGSWEKLKAIKNRSENTTIVRMSKNFGQHAACVCGFKYSKGRFVITIDDDLEVHPQEIEPLIKAQQQSKCDVVYGVYKKLSPQPLRSLFTRIYKLLSKIEGKNKGKGSSFRLMKGDLARKISKNHNQFVFIDEICLWYTSGIEFIAVKPNPDFVLKKRYKISGLFKTAGTVIMFSSTFPLKLVSWFGFLLSFVNFFVGIRILFKKFHLHIEVPGYASLIVSILFSTGIIILCLGVIARYITYSLKSLNNYPGYNEDEVQC